MGNAWVAADRLKWLVALMLLMVWPVISQAASVKNVRMWLAPDHARLVFDLSGPVTHKLFTLQNPDRLVVDIPKSQMKTRLDKIVLGKSPISTMRSSRKGSTLRIVMDLKEKVRPRSFELKPNKQYGHRLVVDLYRNPKKVTQAAVKTPAVNQRREIVISIDAGHGGDDPGALGPGGVREKDVVLAIAKRLNVLLDREPGFRGELTRSGDYYISLRGRTRLARKKNADMFVSIHADAFKNPRARGASVWVLSPRGASSEMGRWLAKRENETDLIGGVGSVSLDDKNKVLKSVLLDMSMTASRADSREIASNIHRNIGRFAKMHKKHVEQAGFVVLKSPDIPSILVETGFISNPGEARKLKTSSYQRRMADAIFRGIKAHFYSKPPANSWVAWKKRGGKDLPVASVPVSSSDGSGDATERYKVVRGDSLSLIAKRNGMSVSQLKALNNLRSNTVRVGQWLTVRAPGSTQVASAQVATSRYKVVRGDSLSRIADRHGMSVAQLKALNKLRSNTVRVGQWLTVRGSSASTTAPVRAATSRYKVVRGDSLSRIADRHGMSVASLKSLNGLRSNTVKIGQILKVKARSVPVPKRIVKYKVVRGDSLSGIADRHGVSLSSLKAENRLSSNTIRIGQVLRIPAS